MTWFGGKLQVGTGSLYSRSIIAHDDGAIIPVRTISLFSLKGAGPAEWEFTRTAGIYGLSGVFMTHVVGFRQNVVGFIKMFASKMQFF